MSAKRKLVSRRSILKITLKASAVAVAPQIIPSSALGLAGAVPPSDRITVAGLGIGGRGQPDLGSFLSQKDVQFMAIRAKVVAASDDSHFVPFANGTVMMRKILSSDR